MKKGLSTIVMIVIMVVILALAVTIYFVVDKNIISKSKVETVEKPKEEISSEVLYTKDTFPKIDASLATQPLTDAIYANFTGTDISKVNIDYTNTHPGYVRLINDEVDLIVVTEPSEEELKLAKEKNVELEVIPVVKEGFVFYVNSKNPVDSLTREQIQKIYSGEITNWKEVGGEDKKIVPYQRPVNSGSQTGMLSIVMKDKKLMEAPKENLVQTMAAIVNLVSQYNNDTDAIGYSYYYYAKTMYETIDSNVASNIKFIGIDGVKPSNETIKNGTYPYNTAYYIVINKADPEGSPARVLAERLLSKRGQMVAQEAGYVPVK